MNIGRLKLKPKGSSTSKSGSPLPPVQVPPNLSQFSSPSNLGPNKSPVVSRSEPSVRFKLEEDIIGSLSVSSASASGSNNEDSLEIMEEIDIPDDESTQDNDASGSISENLVLSAAPAENVPQRSVDNSKIATDRKKQLFDIDNELPGESGVRKFDIDDLQLSGDEIAQHFQSFSESTDLKDEDNKVNLAVKKKLLKQNHDVGSLGTLLDNIESSSDVLGSDPKKEESDLKQKVGESKKELSPLNEDVVLINNSKVSLKSLKKLQKQSNVLDNSGDNSYSTTNDISELARDTESDRIMSDNNDNSSRSDVASKPMDSDKEASLQKLSSLMLRSRSAEIEEKNVQSEDKPEFASLGVVKLCNEQSSEVHDSSVEEDNSIEEMLMSNASVDILAVNEMVLSENQQLKEDSSDSNLSGDLKEKILTSSKSFEEIKSQHELDVPADNLEGNKPVVVKQMEKVVDIKEALEDISEESEQTLTNSNHSESRPNTDDEQSKPLAVVEKGKEIRKILEEKLLHKQLNIESTIYEDNKENIPDSLSVNKSFDLDSVVSLNMFQAMNNEIKQLHEIIATKDMMLEAYSTRDSLKETRLESLRDPQRSSDSSSLATNSTEYRPLNDETVSKKELLQKVADQNQWIVTLAEKLQEINQAREMERSESIKLVAEVNRLTKQLAENADTIKQRPHWMRDQESTGQRISEISIDLVSETDDALSDFPDLYEERSNRNSRERQLDLNLDIDYSEQNPLHIPTAISKQLEQFRKYLSADELRLFNMVQGKFDDYLQQELDKMKTTSEEELKIIQERLVSEKNEHDAEVSRLRQLLSNVKSGSVEIEDLKSELEARHTQEMDDLRTYFQEKVAEFEKQYSEKVLSQHSRQMSNDTASDISDQEEFPEENGGYHSKHTSPKRKAKEDIYLSPTHRKITPTTIDTTESSADEVMEFPMEEEDEAHLTVDSLREYYQNKLKELKRQHEQDLRELRKTFKQFEEKDIDEKGLPNNEDPITNKDTSPHTIEEVTVTSATKPECLPPSAGVILIDKSTTSTTNTTTVDIGTEPIDDLHEIIADYERRLQEQVALARQDVLRELEVQIQALLSDTISEDYHWPPELILLREKLTAKSQLEIAQLQIKHEEEMAKVKADFEKQLQWKLKRQSTFDSARDLDKIISERDNLRELSSTLRSVLCELVRYVSNCEDDLNSTVIDELHKYGIVPGNAEEVLECSALDMSVSNISTLSTKKFLKFTPDVSGLISIIEDPTLLEYISKESVNHDGANRSLNLDECLEKLRSEAMHILSLSEKIAKKSSTKDEDLDKVSVKSDSCEEEDGLKRKVVKKDTVGSRSFDENIVRHSRTMDASHIDSSLPMDLTALQCSGELNVQLHELRNEKRQLEMKLADALSKQNSLVVELNETKQHLLELNSQKVEISEGYGTNALLPCAQKQANSFSELQEKAKQILASSPDSDIDNSTNLLQLVEEFCREGERYMENGKRDKLDLQSQIDAADKQLKATRQFLEDQAAEREQERDEFVKEIEKLKIQLREKDKDKTNIDRVTKELETAEQNIKELSAEIAARDDKIRKLENDLKDSIDKGFTLREIITELETQNESKAIDQHVMVTKIKELESYIDAQNRQNESLHQETDMTVRGYDDKIAKLEEELRQTKPSVEHSLVLEALTVQLRDVEETLERKTKNLETLHANSSASLVCSSPSEDISVNSPSHRKKSAENSSIPPLPVDEVQRIFDKLHRHTRVEEVAIKRINDLEMQICSVRNEYAELQHERDVLQERMSEQSLKITTLQSKLDEQRLRAEELHRQGTSHLTVKVHDLQNEVVNLKETLQTRDKQITSLKNFLENSQQVIERQEKELAMNQADNDRSQYELKLEAELQAKCDEIQQLKNKIQNDMINKLALPDLMETMLADKNEEIDQLKEKLSQLQSQHHPPASHLGHGKEDDNARTLSDIVSITDCDESDMVMRRLPEQNEGLLPTQHSIPMMVWSDFCILSIKETPSNFFNLKEQHQTASTIHSTTHLPTSSSNVSPLQHAMQLPKATLFPLGFEGAFLQDFSAVFPRPTPSTGTSSGGTPEFIPRHINFSLIDNPRSAEGKDRLREPAFIEEIHEQEEEKVMAQTMTASGGKRLSDISENVSEEDKGKLENELESLKMQLDRITNEKNVALERMHAEIQEKIENIEDLQVELAARNKLYEDLLREKKDLRDELEKVKHDLDQLESDACNLQKKENELKEVLESMTHKDQEMCDLKGICNKLREEIEQHVRDSESLKSEQQKNHLLIDTLKQQVESLNKTIGHKDELMSKLEKDILNYSKNEEKYLEQLKVLDAKEIELRLLQGNYKDRMQEIEMLNEDNKFLNEDITRLKNEIAKSSSNSSSNPSYVQFLKQNCEKIEEELRETKALLTEKMLALERVKIDLTSCQREAEDVKSLLKEKEMIIQQIGDDGNTLHQALSNIQNQMQETSGNLNKKLREEQDRNTALLAEIDRLKTLLQRSDNSSSPKPFSVEEIAEQLEKELNYSAQLDSSILKAIESDDVNSDDEANEAIKKSKDGLADAVQLEELTQKLRMEAEKGNKLKEMLEAEKHNSNEIQMQDAEIIEAMRLRLEAAIDNEGTLQKLLSEERSKNERLSTLMAGVQRTKSFDNYLLMKNKSPHDSPSRRLNRSNEFESEMVARFESEIKFLNAQNERERERAIDLQRALERERNRFEKEIADRNEYGEQVKRELMRVTKEKEQLEVELDNEQEKLLLSHKEIESLERRINALQEAESMRSLRKDRSLEFQDIRLRLENVEQERVQLLETNRSLRTEVERRKQNEAHLMEALSRGNSLKESGVPEEFLTKLKDLNRMLEANARENHQQAETLRLMVEERRALQQRIQELERFNVNSNRSNRDDLEERANHLFGKYLRSESHRKALVHQKRYLQIVLTTYEENEAKALQLLNAQNVPMGIQGLSFAKPNADENHPRRKSFRSVVTAIIAIERMKFIVRKWQGGRRVCAKAIFSQQFTPRRSQSATTNVWTRSQNSHFVEYNASPPSRDRAVFHPSVVHQVQNYPSQYLRLPESQLVMNADLRERLEDQYNQTNR
ncbi:A-kinase anchor protein 9 isoform X3 [Aedes aegypti]|uniref:Pericentrin/AKAP-450 centrosomal targeting domain-containing protein n=1 Tax=Aedes aegypti TaxID=7159 RepID=A0A6I8U749_AEDAE|nr:A-kinase anchor protein 9 isoform X3 [Aedes aegypti]